MNSAKLKPTIPTVIRDNQYVTVKSRFNEERNPNDINNVGVSKDYKYRYYRRFWKLFLQSIMGQKTIQSNAGQSEQNSPEQVPSPMNKHLSISKFGSQSQERLPKSPTNLGEDLTRNLTRSPDTCSSNDQLVCRD